MRTTSAWPVCLHTLARVLLLIPLVLGAACETRSGTVDARLEAGADARGSDLRAPDSRSPLLALVEGSRYQADLALVAQARPPGSAHWQLVQDLCLERLGQLGYATERSSYGTGVNLLGRRAGRKAPGELVLISAHYDSVAGCAGADDNASGVAGVLEAARVLASAEHDRTLVIAFFDEEERGLLGSAAYAAQAKQRGDVIRFAFVLDMIGYKSDEPNSQTMPFGMELLWPAQVAAIKTNQLRADFIVACHDESAASKLAADTLVATAELVKLPLYPMKLPAALKDLPELKDLYRGDHGSFWQAGYPAVMINDTSVYRQTHYHCLDGPDTADRLSTAFSAQIIQATVGSAALMLRADGG